MQGKITIFLKPFALCYNFFYVIPNRYQDSKKRFWCNLENEVNVLMTKGNNTEGLACEGILISVT